MRGSREEAASEGLRERLPVSLLLDGETSDLCSIITSDPECKVVGVTGGAWQGTSRGPQRPRERASHEATATGACQQLG